MNRPIQICAFLILVMLIASCVSAADALIADWVLIEKKAHRLTLFAKGRPIKSYKVALGRNPDGPKEKEGDKRTPEGIYVIDSRNANSRYHLALHISYPDRLDVLRAKKQGVSPGGDIMIHGLPHDLGRLGKLHRLSDWTSGCIAVTNSEIEEIWRLVPDGTPIEIKP